MAILLSGDYHANEAGELAQITRGALIKTFKKQLYDRIKYHVILGDTGFLWPRNIQSDVSSFQILAERPFPVLCVVGNHEPVLGMSNLNEVDIGIGETVYQIFDDPFIAFMKRGKVYTIDGFRFLVLGGALSIDREYRVPGLSWWKEEYWSPKETRDVLKLLKNDNSFDYVLSHTGPDSINDIVFRDFMQKGGKFDDEVSVLNDRIDSMIACKGWWCGHWHRDRFYFDDKRKREYHYLYRTPVILEEKDGTIERHHRGYIQKAV